MTRYARKVRWALVGAGALFMVGALWPGVSPVQAAGTFAWSLRLSSTQPPGHPGDDTDGDAMHEACLRGDWDAMEGLMDRVHPDWRGHMGAGAGGRAALGGMGSMGGGMMGRGAPGP